MYILATIFVFLLGTVIGSFLNVVIYRFNTGRSMVNSRSVCMSCNKTLRWYELIPVFSFLIQSGRCRRCASSISHQYPMVEFITGVVFTLISFHLFPIFSYSYKLYLFLVIFYAFVFSVLIVISVYDIRHKIIPDRLVYFLIFIGFLSLFINYTGGSSFFTTPTLIRLISGPLFALPFALIWLVGKGRWMGLGDAKLILALAWIFPPLETFAILTLSFWIGSITSLLLMFFSRKKIGMKTEIPFAPFMVLSALLVFLLGLDISSLIALFKL